VNLEHWKDYEPVEDVAVFDTQGKGPSIERLQVMANVSHSLSYPECRIALGVASIGTIALTVDQSATLRRELELAEVHVRAALLASEEPSDG